MENKGQYLSFAIIALIFIGSKNNLKAQTFINPYIGYGITKLKYEDLSEIPPLEHALPSFERYKPSVYLGFSIIKPINKYWGIDFQADISHQKFLLSGGSFNERSRVYFWHFRNAIIPTLNIGEKWRGGIGLNFNFSDFSKSHFNIDKEVEFGVILQIGYQLNKHFNLHFNYRRGLKTISDQFIYYDPFQSLNIGLGYQFNIKNKRDR